MEASRCMEEEDMSANGYARRRRQRAPKPVSVPIWVMVVGILLLVLGHGNLEPSSVAGLGLIFFFYGLVSLTFLLIGRRRRAAGARR